MSAYKIKRPPAFPVRKSNPPVSTNEGEIAKDEATFDRFLGVVSSVNANDGSEPHVYLRPLFRWDLKWTAVQPREKELVCWQNAPSNVLGGTLWAFGLVREKNGNDGLRSANPSSNDLQDSSASLEHSSDSTEVTPNLIPAFKSSFARIVSEDPVFVYEIVKQEDGTGTRQRSQGDLPLEEIEAVRRRYILQGVEGTPLGPILAEIKNECVIGPLILHCGLDGRWRAEPQMIAVRAPLPPKSFHTLDMESGKRKIRLANEDLPGLITEVDFRSDEETIIGAIGELRGSNQRLRSDEAPQETVRQLLAEIAALYRPAAEPAEAYKRFRLESALKGLEEQATLTEQWQYAVLDTPEAKATLEIAKRNAIADAFQERTDALADLQEQLDEQRALLTAVQIELQERQKQLGELKSQTIRASEELTNATDARIASITAKVVEKVADLFVGRIPVPQTIISEPSAPLIASTEGLPNELIEPKIISGLESSPVLATWKDSESEQDVSDCAEAIARFRKRLAATGFSGSLAVQLFAAWLSDLIPVIAGTDSLRFLRCAAEIISARRILMVPITGDVMSVADLFGKVHVPSRTYIPSPSGLADLFLAAEQGELDGRFGIVAFSGVNMTDTASAFLPLIESFCGVWEDTSEPTLPIIHPTALLKADPYTALCRTSWPTNLLPAFTLANGVSPLPPPPVFWENAMLIMPCALEANKPTKRYYEIRRSGWEEGRTRTLFQTPSVDQSPNENLRDRRLIGALLACGVSKEEAHRIVFLGRRLPYLLSSGQEPQDGSVPAGTDQTAMDNVRRTLLYGSG